MKIFAILNYWKSEKKEFVKLKLFRKLILICSGFFVIKLENIWKLMSENLDYNIEYIIIFGILNCIAAEIIICNIIDIEFDIFYPNI